ncbi:MAG: ABC transporter permease [Bacteroidales bacterium]
MRKALGYVWGTVFVIVLWWVCAALIGSPALPTPAATLPALADNIGKIAPEFMVSLGRILLSMAIGALFGVPLGLWIGRSKRADAIFGPVLYVLYPVPKIVFLPVLFVLFGLGGEGKVVLIAIAVFFQMMVTMRDAAKNVPTGAVESMRSLGAGKFAIYRDVIFPATVPDLFTALRITCGTAVAILFIAESMAGSVVWVTTSCTPGRCSSTHACSPVSLPWPCLACCSTRPSTSLSAASPAGAGAHSRGAYGCRARVACQ